MIKIMYENLDELDDLDDLDDRISIEEFLNSQDAEDFFGEPIIRYQRRYTNNYYIWTESRAYYEAETSGPYSPGDKDTFTTREGTWLAYLKANGSKEFVDILNALESKGIIVDKNKYDCTSKKCYYDRDDPQAVFKCCVIEPFDYNDDEKFYVCSDENMRYLVQRTGKNYNEQDIVDLSLNINGLNMVCWIQEDYY